MIEIRRLEWLLLLIGIGWILSLLSPILMPFVISALLAYLGDPLVKRLEGYRWPRTYGVLLVFTLLFLMLTGAMVLLLPHLERQIDMLLAKLPEYIQWLEAVVLPWVNAKLPMETDPDQVGLLRQAVTEHWSKAGGLLATLVSSVSQSGMMLLGWLASLVLIPVITFYLLRDWDKLMAAIADLLPGRIRQTSIDLAQEVDQVLGGFLRGQLSVMLILGLIYGLGLWLAGLELALLVGLIAGLVSFVPYLGLIVGLLMAVVASVLQYQGMDILHWILLVFVIGQILESVFLTPKLVGDRIGLHPVAVIFAVMAAAQIYGFFGVLLALPVAAVVMVLVRYSLKKYRASAAFT